MSASIYLVRNRFVTKVKGRLHVKKHLLTNVLGDVGWEHSDSKQQIIF